MAQPQPASLTMTRRLRPILLVFLILPLAGIVAAGLMIAASNNDPGAISQVAADVTPRFGAYRAPEFELTDLDGNPVSLADYAGRPLLLNFWQTTCEPCIREMPAFEEFIASQDEVAVLTVNFNETTTKVKQFFAEIGVSAIPVAMDFNSDVRREYGVVNIPVTFGIDGTGMVRFMKLGEMTFDEMETFGESLAEG